MARAPRPSIHDVAREAGVAIATVSRVMSGNASVATELRERVLAAAAALNYQPDRMAQGLRMGRSRTIGYITDDLSNPVTALIASGAESVLREAGQMLVVMNSEHDRVIEETHLRLLRARRIDATILAPAEDSHPGLIAALGETEIPVVLMEADRLHGVGASVVVSDHRAGVREAVTRLIAIGHRRIGLLPGPLRHRAGRERLAGANEAAALAGVASIRYEECDLHADHGSASAIRLLAARPRPTALIVGGNQMLEGVLAALHSLGLGAGTDIALITSDEVGINRVHNPRLTAVSRDAFGMGVAAANILLRQIAVKVAPETVILPTTLLWRESCPPARRGSPRDGTRRD